MSALMGAGAVRAECGERERVMKRTKSGVLMWNRMIGRESELF